MLVPAKIPKLIRFLGKGLVFSIPTTEKEVYLTFDDGPIEHITPWVLDQLEAYNAKATFFLVGENVVRNPEIVTEILNAGHSIGNHTQNHINGFATKTKNYIADIEKCRQTFSSFEGINSKKLFRPPYGRIFPKQAFHLRKMGFRIIMWDVLSMDYRSSLSPDKCIRNVIQNVQNGSIVVFHDSLKAEKNLKVTLPSVLATLKNQGYHFRSIQ